MDLSLEQIGILYSMVLSTGGVAWQAITSWKGRRRLRFEVRPHYVTQRDPFPDGYFTRASLDLVLTNIGGSAIHIQRWEPVYDRSATRGVTVTEQTGVSGELSPFAERRVQDLPPRLFSSDLKGLEVVDVAGTRWRCSRAVAKAATEAAAKVIEFNNSRKPGPQPPFDKLPPPTPAPGIFGGAGSPFA